MSQPHRNPESAASPANDTGGGCAMLLIVAGFGIAAVAAGIGLVAAFFVFDVSDEDAVAAQPIVTEIYSPAPTAAPTATPAATPTVAPTAPPPVSEPDGADDYLEQATEITGALQESFERYIALMETISADDPGWRAAFEAELDLWESLQQEVGEIVPPPENLGSYAELQHATTLIVEAAAQIRPGVLEDDVLTLVAGIEQLTDSLSHLFDAISLIEQERLQHQQ